MIHTCPRRPLMPAVQDDSQRNRRTAKRILAIGLPLVVIAGTGIGYAYWTSTGSGTGTAAAGATPTAQLSVTIPDLVPGSSVTGLVVSATNTSSTTLSINSFSVGTLGITGAAGNCAAVTLKPTATAHPTGSVLV